MKNIISKMFVGIALFAMLFQGVAMSKQQAKKAIVIAGFGTTYLSALQNITNIRDEVQREFPGVKVKCAFTSNIIRKIWHSRRNDKGFTGKNASKYNEFLNVKGILGTIGDLQDEGYTDIVVQSTHIFAGEEFTDLTSYIDGLNSITTIKKKFMPFKSLLLGRPALGKSGVVHDYHKDLKIGAEALAADVKLTRQNNAALVYMGHGNEFFSTGIYAEFQEAMRRQYPQTKIFIGTVEGFPALENVLDALKRAGVKKVILKPLMVVAGDHANNDMAGDSPDSWKNKIEKLGIKVIPVIKGLGENPQWVTIYVQHIKDILKDNNHSF